MTHRYYVAIPSYGRPEMCAKTIRNLVEGGVPAERISVFLSDYDGESVAYREAIDDFTINVWPGAPGIVGNRNAITDFYEDGDRVVSIDDDITKILVLDPDTGKLDDGYSADDIFQNVWASVTTRLWGIDPTGNPFYMSNRVSTGWQFAIGCLHGYVVDKSLPPLSIETKEDYERSALYFEADGGVTKVRFLTTNNKYGATPGGLGTDRDDRNRAAAAALLERWPYLFAPKKDSDTEIRLRRL